MDLEWEEAEGYGKGDVEKVEVVVWVRGVGFESCSGEREVVAG